MYTEHFGLNEKPFSISPDPRYLYLSPRHADALAHLLYGISESGGFIQLTGEIGTGKTTLIRSLLGQLPENAEIALILNPRLSTKQFLQAICHELRVHFVDRETGKALIDKLNARLLKSHAENRRVVLIVDEAQTMSPELLEQVRLLTNLETEKQKLLQIILIGQPELRDILARSDMRQIAQRITGRYHLEPLNAADTAVYVAHRMRIAGGRPEIFRTRAVRKLFRLSRGVPRLINIVADRALLAAYARDESRISAGLVGKAASEVFGRPSRLRWWPWAATVAGLAMLLWGAWLEQGNNVDEPLALAMADSAAAPISTPSSAQAIEPESANLLVDTGSLTELLDAGTPSADDTLSALFQLWGVDYSPAAGPACTQAAAAGLRCLTLRNSSIGELRALNRPVSLELLTNGGAPQHLLLAGLGDKYAVVVIGNTTERIPIADLTQHAFGEQLLLFRPAITDDAESLAEGTSGAGVIWLRATLESIYGTAIPAEEAFSFDAALKTAIMNYQRNRGLTVDGVVGDRTLISLQTDIGLVGVSLKAGMY
jgi:general secretion pathway protein A